MSEIFLEGIGYLGAVFLALCAAPLAIEAGIKQDMSHHNTAFLVLWFVGELLLFYYSAALGALPLLLNYGLNIVLLSPVMLYHFWPKSNIKGSGKKV